jgi:hypothetical protein
MRIRPRGPPILVKANWRCSSRVLTLSTDMFSILAASRREKYFCIFIGVTGRKLTVKGKCWLCDSKVAAEPLPDWGHPTLSAPGDGALDPKSAAGSRTAIASLDRNPPVVNHDYSKATIFAYVNIGLEFVANSSAPRPERSNALPRGHPAEAITLFHCLSFQPFQVGIRLLDRSRHAHHRSSRSPFRASPEDQAQSNRLSANDLITGSPFGVITLR